MLIDNNNRGYFQRAGASLDRFLDRGLNTIIHHPFAHASIPIIAGLYAETFPIFPILATEAAIGSLHYLAKKDISLLDIPSLSISLFYALRDWKMPSVDEAILAGDLPLAKFESSEKLDLNTKDFVGNTWLHKAAKNINQELIKFLVQSGADINAKNICGETPIHSAVLRKLEHVNVIKLLVELGANIEEKDSCNRTPLFLAAHQNRFDSVKMLLQLGANIEAKNHNGCTALQNLILESKQTEATRLIELGANIDAQLDNGNTLLHDAIEGGKIDLAQRLIDLGANVDAINRFGRTALHLAAEEGKIVFMETLLQRGADIEAKDLWGRSPLHWATIKEKADSIKTLVQHYANIHAKDNDGRTPLHLAAIKRTTRPMTTLLELGANVDAIDKEGCTPLHLAVKHQWSVSSIKTLCSYFADIEAKDLKGRTPLHYAAERSPDFIKTLAELGANVDAIDKDSNTPLHLSAIKKRLDTFKNLLELGANIYAKNKFGKPPLYYGPKYNNFTENLINSLPLPISNLSPALRDYLYLDKNFTLDEATKTKDIPLIMYLLQEEHGITKQNCQDKTFYLLACQSKNEDVKKLLLDHAKKVMKNYTEAITEEKTPDINQLREAISCGGDLLLEDQNGKTLQDFSLPDISSISDFVLPEEIPEDWSTRKDIPVFLDPIILGEWIRKPVVDPTSGKTIYDEDSLVYWLSYDSSSPMTKRKLKKEDLILLPHLKLAIAWTIKELMEERPPLGDTN